MRTGHFNVSRTVSSSWFLFLILPLPQRKWHHFAKDQDLMELHLLDWVWLQHCWLLWSGYRWKSQLMKHNVLWIITAKHFACSKFIGVYARCVSSHQDDNLIAAWFVASQVNTCKSAAVSCVTAEGHRGWSQQLLSFVFLKRKKKKWCRGASSSKGSWGSITQVILSVFILFSWLNAPVCSWELPRACRRRTWQCFGRKGRFLIYRQALYGTSKHPFSKEGQI